MTEEFRESEYKDTNEEVNFNRKKDETITYKQIVLRAIEKCRIEGSKQMSRGMEVFMKQGGNYIPHYIEDQRKIFGECVLQLKFLLMFAFDDEAKEKIFKYESNIKNAHEKFLGLYIDSESFEPYKEYAINSGQFNLKSLIASNFMQHMEDYILLQYQKMYQELLILFKKRKNELSIKRTVGLYEK